MFSLYCLQINNVPKPILFTKSISSTESDSADIPEETWSLCEKTKFKNAQTNNHVTDYTDNPTNGEILKHPDEETIEKLIEQTEVEEDEQTEVEEDEQTEIGEDEQLIELTEDMVNELPLNKCGAPLHDAILLFKHTEIKPYVPVSTEHSCSMEVVLPVDESQEAIEWSELNPIVKTSTPLTINSERNEEPFMTQLSAGTHMSFSPRITSSFIEK